MKKNHTRGVKKTHTTMESSMNFSDSVAYFARKMAAFTTNQFRLSPQGKSDGVQAGDIVTFMLPSNALVNLDSFQVHFNAGVSGTFGRLPAGIDRLLQQVDVMIGGVQVGASHPYYGVLCAMLDAVSYKHGNPVSGHPQIVRGNSEIGFGGLDEEGLAGSTPQLGNAFLSSSSTPYSITKWRGFLGSVQPRIIDTSLLGTVEVRLTFAQNSVVTSSTGTAESTAPLFGLEVADKFTTPAPGGTATYQVQGIYASVETCSFPGGVYDQMVSQELDQGGLQLPFKNYFAQNQAHSGSSSFSCSTQSLDRVWCGFRATYDGTGSTTAPAYKSYLTQNSPIPVPGYLADACEARHGISKEKYTSAPFCFCCLGVANTIQLSINNASTPQYPLPISSLPSYTACNLPDGEYFNDEMTLIEFLGVANVMCTRLNIPGSEYRREISGLDTRSSSILMKLNTSGQQYAGSSFDSIVFMECTSTLIVQPGRQSSVIQ